jgi:hypothetical protein
MQAGKLTRVKQVRYHYAVGKKLLTCCVVTIVLVQSSAFDKSHRNEPKTHYLWLAEAEVQVSIGFGGLPQGSEISYTCQVTLAGS